MDEDSYEEAVMDIFINARARGICRRLVINEYFGNKKCTSLIVHPLPASLVN